MGQRTTKYIADQTPIKSDPRPKLTIGLGDVVAGAIKAGAVTVDKVAGTKLAQKADDCIGCGKKKEKLNKAFSVTF